jgi:integrase
MPKLKHLPPSYRHHKASGQAVVCINGRDLYLGPYNTSLSRSNYNRIIAEWAANDGTLPGAAEYSVAELLAAYLTHARSYHQPKELERIKLAMGPIRALYTRTDVAKFGPLALKAVRQAMIEANLARTTINDRVDCIRRVFKWGVENELVPPSVLHGLQAVAGLRFGRSAARETLAVKPVPDAFVDAVLPHVSPQVGAMIELQRLTGMRSGEVTIMRGRDVNTAGRVWVYTPETHKTAYRGHDRKVYLGPKAQSIIRPFLKADLQAYLFSPAESLSWIHGARHAKRSTPLSCGNRPGTNRKRVPRKSAGDAYNSHSYRRAVSYGIEAVNKARLADAEAKGIAADRIELVPSWHPHQLRHNAAAALRREHGIEVARIILGHRSAAVTEIYAQVDHEKAIELMGKIG